MIGGGGRERIVERDIEKLSECLRRETTSIPANRFCYPILINRRMPPARAPPCLICAANICPPVSTGARSIALAEDES
jgi:hypothetical protein